MNESDLYPPLKTYLQAQGYEIKGEVGQCDVFARRGTEHPLIVELKLSLNLSVILQVVDRLSLSPTVYVGVPRQCSALSKKRKAVLKLFRLLGIGLLTIDPDRSSGGVSILLDPGDYRPRISKQKQSRLLREFEQRVGDPNQGGSVSRGGMVTAYRQSAIRIAMLLRDQGPTRASLVAQQSEEKKARDIMYRNHYGWFEAVSRGVYQLTPRGAGELEFYEKTLDQI